MCVCGKNLIRKIEKEYNVSNSVTWPYVNMWNRHRMFITDIGIPKHKNTYDFLVQVQNIFITFELKVFLTWGERYTIFLCWLSHLPTTMHGTSSQTTGLISASPKSQPSSSDAKTQLPDFSQILRARFRCMTSFTSLVTFSIWDFYFDISEWHILPARVNTCTHVAPN